MQFQRMPNANVVTRFMGDETATTAIEYALIASVISIAILGSVMATGSALIDNFYNKVTDGLDSANGG